MSCECKSNNGIICKECWQKMEDGTYPQRRTLCKYPEDYCQNCDQKRIAALEAENAGLRKLVDMLEVESQHYQLEYVRLREALEYVRKHAPLCNHDDPTWCDEVCMIPWVVKKALAALGGRDE